MQWRGQYRIVCIVRDNPSYLNSETIDLDIKRYLTCISIHSLHTQENWKYIHTKTFMQVFILHIVHNSITHKSQKIETNQNIHQLINKVRYSHTKKYYSSIKRNEVVIHTMSWVNFEDITLKWKKPDTESHIMYDFIYMRCP